MPNEKLVRIQTDVEQQQMMGLLEQDIGQLQELCDDDEIEGALNLLDDMRNKLLSVQSYKQSGESHDGKVLPSSSAKDAASDAGDPKRR